MSLVWEPAGGHHSSDGAHTGLPHFGTTGLKNPNSSTLNNKGAYFKSVQWNDVLAGLPKVKERVVSPSLPLHSFLISLPASVRLITGRQTTLHLFSAKMNHLSHRQGGNCPTAFCPLSRETGSRDKHISHFHKTLHHFFYSACHVCVRHKEMHHGC